MSTAIINKVSFSSSGQLDVVCKFSDKDAALADSILKGTKCEMIYGGARDTVAGTLVSQRDDSLVLRFAVEATDQPLRAVRITGPDSLTLAPDVQQFLGIILPDDDAAFSQSFISQTQRYGDATTQFFTARQISRHFSGKRAYRAASGVVMAYKAIETDDRQLQKEALAELRDHIRNIGECDIHRHPRENREHLLVSLLCVKWHVELSLKRHDAFRATLEESARLCTELSNYFTPSYNLSLSMLMLCMLVKQQGDAERAKDLADQGLAVFKAAAADATDQLTFLTELQICHRSVVQMYRVSKVKSPPQEDFDTGLKQCLRVRGPSVERLKKIFWALATAEPASTAMPS